MSIGLAWVILRSLHRFGLSISTQEREGLLAATDLLLLHGQTFVVAAVDAFIIGSASRPIIVASNGSASISMLLHIVVLIRWTTIVWIDFNGLVCVNRCLLLLICWWLLHYSSIGHYLMLILNLVSAALRWSVSRQHRAVCWASHSSRHHRLISLSFVFGTAVGHC